MIGRVCVTGGAGFIGSHMCDTLLDAGIEVRVVDNLRTGRLEFVDQLKVDLYPGDILDTELLLRAIDGCDWVVHLAANPDARGERRGVQFDLQQNLLGTASVLDAMRHVGTSRILYASSASIYGNTTQSPTPEDYRSVTQASFYGASKLAAEGLIGAYCEMFGFTGILGRWVHILGERYLHGHIIDFLRKLRRDPTQLHILGDGRQAKSGLHARNLTDGLLSAMRYHDLGEGACEAYNFGGDSLLSVTESAELICDWVYERYGHIGHFQKNVELTYSGRTNGGWVGDNPSLVLDSTKARERLGWAPTMSVPDGIRTTVEYLMSEHCTYL